MKTIDLELDLAPEERGGEFDLTPVVYDRDGIWVPGEQIEDQLKAKFAIAGLAMIGVAFAIAALSPLF